MITKKQFVLFLIMLLPVVAVAEEPMLIDGIYYNLIPKGKQVEVTRNPNGFYTGIVIIPDSVTYNGTEYSVTCIGDRAFYYCSGLTSVKIPISVTRIGEDAFNSCSGLTSVYISDIAAWCDISFSGPGSNPLGYARHLYLGEEEIKDLVIPNSVMSIGEWTFNGCSSLTSVSIPNSVMSIGLGAFGGCSSLTSVSIPNSVTSIGQQSFSNCRGLTSVIIPNSVTSIGQSAFNGCSGLTTITIGNSVTSIGQWAFFKCSALTSVIIPNSVTSIGDLAFCNCSSLVSIKIGSGVTSIGGLAFASCKELTDVYCQAERVPMMYEYNGYYGEYKGTYAFEDSYIEYADLHVPFASIDAYKTVEPWKNFKRIIALIGEEIPEVKKCDKPIIIRDGNKIRFECETPGATFESKITQEFEGDEVVFMGSDISYTLTVIASAEGYEDSDPVKMTLFIDNCDVNKDGTVDVADIATIIDRMTGK